MAKINISFFQSINQSIIYLFHKSINKSLQLNVCTNKTCQAHKSTYGSLITITNNKTIYTLEAHW